MEVTKTVNTYREFYDAAAAIAAQIEQLATVLAQDDGLKEYVDLYMDRASCYDEEDTALITTVDFVFEMIFRHKMQKND